MMNKGIKIRVMIYGFVLLILAIAYLLRRQADEITVMVQDDRTVHVAGDTVQIGLLGDILTELGTDRRTKFVIVSADDIPMAVIHDVREQIEVAGGMNITYEVKGSTSRRIE
jgi:hypothetical protein